MHPDRWLVFLLLSGCTLPLYGGAPGDAELSVEKVGFTSCVRAEDGKTLITVQFIARQGERPLGADEVVYELIEDGSALDVESLLDESAEELASSLDLWLVLDASYSVVDSQAFVPMLAAASDLLTKVAAEWSARPGTFSWHLSWFAEYLFVATGVWQPDDVLALPSPTAGTATKLFAAVDHAAGGMDDALGAGVAPGARDQRVMVVFTDGLDNYSWWDNAGDTSASTTTAGASFVEIGWPATSLSDALASIQTDADRMVYGLALGEDVAGADELRALADAGGGRVFSQADPANVDQLFAEMAQQLTTLRTIGALVPLPPGDHTFETRVHLGSLAGPSASFSEEVRTAEVAACAPAR